MFRRMSEASKMTISVSELHEEFNGTVFKELCINKVNQSKASTCFSAQLILNTQFFQWVAL